MNDTLKDYVFISYSHKDDISSLLDWFSTNGYNAVYDSELSAGDLWDMKVRRYIKSPKCKGVISIISRASLSSTAILKETEYTALYSRESVCITLDNCSLVETANKLVKEEEIAVSKEILEYFPPEKIFIKKDDILNNQSDLLKKTLSDWGLKQELENATEEIVLDKYSSNIPGEKSRLSSQQKGYYSFDMSAIDSVLKKYPEDKKLTVLDLGCSNGELTTSRFSDARFENIIGIDYNQGDIDDAIANRPDDRFKYFCMDLEDKDFISNLKKTLNDLGIGKVDIVFMALTLHHLKDPKRLLFSLYDVFDGYIIIRGSDDGGKLCYPDNELMQELFNRYNNLIKEVSDRRNGRKLYKLLLDSGYINISMLYQTIDTCEKTRQEKISLYQIGFTFRENRLKEALKNNPHNEELRKEVEWQLNALEKIHELFGQRDFWYCNTSYIAIASVK